jgi:hypothetical protein
MKTIREQIIERIIAQLETITVANGYHHDIGHGNVGRQEPIIQKGKTPAASVWELSETRERNRYGGTVRILTVRVECLVQPTDGRHPGLVSNELLGDIEKALIMGNLTLDELIDDIQDISAEIITPTMDRRLESVGVYQLPIDRQLAGAAIEFEIRYTTEWGDPYTTQ